MKKLLFSLAFLCFSIQFLYSQSSTVTIFTQEGEKIWVVVDGEKKNKDPQTKVVIENLKAQNYKFKVIFQDSKIPSLDKTIYTKDVDNNYHNSTYVVRKDTKGAKYVIRVNSDEIVTSTTTTTTTPDNTNVTTTTTVSQPGQQNQTTQTYNQTTTSTTNSSDPQNMNIGIGMNVTETPDGVNMNVNMGGVNVNTNVNGTGNGMNSSTNMNANGINTSNSTNGVNTSNSTITSSTTTTTTTTTTSSSNNNVAGNNQNQQRPIEHHQQQAYVLPGYSGPAGCPMPMSNENFSTAKNSISSKSFEDSKITIAKQIVGNNCLLCSQVKEIMKLFSFEDSRLEFAKFAYKHTFDIGNYYQLNDAFTFESSIDELNEYINNNK